MNKKVLAVVLIIIALIVGGVAYTSINTSDGSESKGDKVKITHRYGETEVPVNPKKVVVLDYSALDVMKFLGVEAIAVPKNSLPAYLEEYKNEKYVDLGTLKEFSLEKINELKPDLIIIEGRQESFYDELSKIAPTIGLGTVNNDHMGSLEKNATILGQVFDEEKKTEKKLAQIKKDIEDINIKVKGENLNAQVIMVSDGAMSAMGKETRYKTIFNEFGFAENDATLGNAKHGQNVSYEYLIEKNPNYLFVVDKGQIVGKQKPAKEIVENEIVKKTDAYKNNNLVYLTPQTWYLGGPGITSTEEMIKEIQEAIK